MSPNKQVLIAHDRILTKEGWKIVLQSLFDIFIRGLNVTINRTVVEESKKILPDVWPYKKSSRCRKCGHFHVLSNTPIRYYDSKLNVLVRQCDSCGFDWNEICEDGSDPIQEYIWMGEEKMIKKVQDDQKSILSE